MTTFDSRDFVNFGELQLAWILISAFQTFRGVQMMPS
jgi:hypothetical protein